MTDDIKTPKRGRPPKYADIGEAERKRIEREQAAERQARKRSRDRGEAAATDMVLRTLSDALLHAAKERLIDPVALLDSLQMARAWPTKPEVEVGIGFEDADRLWTRFKRAFFEGLHESRSSLIPPGVGDPLADPTDEEWQRMVHRPFIGYFPNGGADARVRFVSLFSGIGAPDLAFCRRGWRCLAHAEIEPFPSAVLATRFPDIPNYGDITALDWKAERARIGPVHLVVGGPPCQSYSAAGQGGGMDDPRGALTLKFVDVVSDLDADAFVFENVDRILSAPSGDDVDLKGRDFAMLLQKVSKAGYVAAWGMYDGRRYGVPQSRRRVFMVGMKSGRWEWPALAAYGPNIDLSSPAAALASLAGKGGRPVRVEIGDDPVAMAVAVGGKWAKAGILVNGEAWGAERIPEAAVEGITLRTHLDHHVERPSPIGTDAAASLHRRFSHDTNPELAPLWAIAEAMREGADTTSIEYIPEHAGTVTRSRGVNQRGGLRSMVKLPGEALRRLTPGEKERVQGFPTGWTDIEFNGKRATLGDRDGAIGNSMVVNVLGWLADNLDPILPEIVWKSDV